MPIKIKVDNLKAIDIKTLQKKAALNALDRDLDISLKEVAQGKLFGPYRSGNELKKALRA